MKYINYASYLLVFVFGFLLVGSFHKVIELNERLDAMSMLNNSLSLVPSQPAVAEVAEETASDGPQRLEDLNGTLSMAATPPPDSTFFNVIESKKYTPEHVELRRRIKQRKSVELYWDAISQLDISLPERQLLVDILVSRKESLERATLGHYAQDDPGALRAIEEAAVVEDNKSIVTLLGEEKAAQFFELSKQQPSYDAIKKNLLLDMEYAGAPLSKEQHRALAKIMTETGYVPKAEPPLSVARLFDANFKTPEEKWEPMIDEVGMFLSEEQVSVLIESHAFKVAKQDAYKKVLSQAMRTVAEQPQQN